MCEKKRDGQSSHGGKKKWAWREKKNLGPSAAKRGLAGGSRGGSSLWRVGRQKVFSGAQPARHSAGPVTDMTGTAMWSNHDVKAEREVTR